jgi:MoxR-like ATPase
MDPSVAEYILQIVERTRQAPGVDIGISPRGSLALYRGAQARAMIEGRDYVLPDDVKQMCKPVFLHRLVCRGSADRGVNGHAARMLDGILDSVPVPV